MLGSYPGVSGGEMGVKTYLVGKKFVFDFNQL